MPPNVVGQRQVQAKQRLEDLMERHTALKFITGWLERGEDWVVDPKTNIDIFSKLSDMMDDVSPKVDISDANIASNVLNALNASAVLAIIDWIDTNPDNDIGEYFLSDHSGASDSFKRRLRHMLLIFLRAELLSLFFNKEHLSWVRKYL